MTHPVMMPGNTAVVTGAASGIGLAACKRFAALGMRVCMTDIDAAALDDARSDAIDASGAPPDSVMARPADVGKLEDLLALKDTVYRDFGEVSLLMNNAVTRVTGSPWEGYDNWQQAINVNLWGVINGVQAFVPSMIAQKEPCVIVNVGSKQGITNPPSNPPYNVAKAAVKAYTELLQHELRNTEGCNVSAHLLIPGMTTTGNRAHRPGAWMPDQVVDYLLAALARDDFYILCPDGEVTPEMDRKRILWSAGDIVDNRPALSRWHRNHTAAFENFRP